MKLRVGQYVESIPVVFMRSKLSIAHFLAYFTLYARYEAQLSICLGPFIEIAMKKRENKKMHFFLILRLLIFF